MFLFLFSLVLAAIVLFFYGIDVWYLSVLPLLIFFLFFGYAHIKTPSIGVSSKSLLNYSLYIAWILVLFALLGVLSFFRIGFPYDFLWLIVANIVLWIVSYIVGYNDGKSLFQFGYYILLAVFLLVCGTKLSLTDFFDLLFFLSLFHMSVTAFIVFIVGIGYEIERNLYYTFFVTLISVLFFLVIKVLSSHFTVALALDSILLTGIYSAFWRFIQKKPPVRERISVRRILAGERVTSHVFFSHKMLHWIYEFIDTMPVLYKNILESLNVFLVISLIVYFLGHRGNLGDLNQFLYWVVISFFVGNVLLLKKIQYTSIVQNLFLFLVFHFAIYVSFFSYFEGNFQSIATWAIVWNLATSVFLFYADRILGKTFIVLDYWYWIVASLLSFIINVILLINSQLAGELIFFLVLLYVGVEGILLFYGSRHVLSLEEME